MDNYAINLGNQQKGGRKPRPVVGESHKQKSQPSDWDSAFQDGLEICHGVTLRLLGVELIGIFCILHVFLLDVIDVRIAEIEA